jgi:hypothetical protein
LDAEDGVWEGKGQPRDIKRSFDAADRHYERIDVASIEAVRVVAGVEQQSAAAYGRVEHFF